MDLRSEADSPEAGMDARADLVADAPVDVPDRPAEGAGKAPTSQGSSLANLIALRDRVRRTLHNSLDDLLDTPAQNPEIANGLGGVVLDEVVIDQLNGLGVNVSLTTRHPNADGHVPEDPEAIAAANGNRSPGGIHLIP